MLTRTSAVCFALSFLQFSAAEELKAVRLPHGVVPAVAIAVQSAPQPVQDGAIQPTGDDSQVPPPGSKQALIQKKLSEADRLQREIQALQAESGSHQQIVVRVQLLEVSLTKLRKLGIEVKSLSDGNSTVTDIASLQKAMGTRDSADQGAADVHAELTNANAIIGLTDWLEHNNLSKVLARPTLSLLSGRSASVFIGDELPVPAGPEPKSGVNFQKFGTELNLVATASGKNKVRMEIRARVSERDAAHSIQVNGFNVPALKVRQFDTAVDATNNEPVVFHGLVDKRQVTQKTSDGHIKEVENEIVLMVVAIPELVDPRATAKLQPRSESRK